MKQGTLFLENGSKFDGYLFGAAMNTAGEVGKCQTVRAKKKPDRYSKSAFLCNFVFLLSQQGHIYLSSFFYG